jgi:uncharacterized membrane protein SirB2
MMLLKQIHVTCVVLTFALFSLRAGWMLWRPEMLRRSWVRILPHLIDTLLLLSALALAYRIGQYPFVHGWLTAKVVGLLCYIGFGTVALKRGKTVGIRGLALVGAYLSFFYIVAVALTHQPLPWLSLVQSTIGPCRAQLTCWA